MSWGKIIQGIRKIVAANPRDSEILRKSIELDFGQK